MTDEIKVCHYTDFEVLVGGGIEQSFRQQREALKEAEIEWTADPSEDFEILHLNTLTPLSIYQMLKAKINGKKVIYHVHSTSEDFEGSFRFSERISPIVDKFLTYIYSKADILIAPSHHTRKLLKDKNLDDIEVVSNSFDQDRLEGYQDLDREKLREKYNVDRPVVVNLAAVFERKGVPSFIETAERMPEIDFVWFGSKVNKLLQTKKINKLLEKSPENTQFPGFVEDPREAFALGDVFFFPSTAEHQPVSLLEALQCGMPIVVRDIPQYNNWLRDGENALKADSPEGFEEKILEIIENKELKEKLSENAKEEAQKHTPSEIGKSLRKVYQKCLQNY